jgi:hypothetical protein
MKTNTYRASEYRKAIARSISHTEIAYVTAKDPRATLEALENDEHLYDLDYSSENNGDLDVWGRYRGEDFRLSICAE